MRRRIILARGAGWLRLLAGLKVPDGFAGPKVPDEVAEWMCGCA